MNRKTTGWVRAIVFVATLVVPFIPFEDGSFFDWMCGYTVDSFGNMTTGYIQAYLLCWIMIALPLVIIEGLVLRYQSPSTESPAEE